MKNDNRQIPATIKRLLRTVRLDELKNTSIFDSYELELFDWYVQGTEKLITEMLSAERVYIQEQVDAGAEDINDSGIVAAEYYLMRVRYSHVIYMTSLLESFLEMSCENLAKIVGVQNTTSKLNGISWVKRLKFVEEYGKFNLPKNICSEIDVLIILRNNFVHDNGSTNELKFDHKSTLDKQLLVNLSGPKIEIEAEYIHSAFKAIKSLIQFVEARLREITV